MIFGEQGDPINSILPEIISEEFPTEIKTMFSQEELYRMVDEYRPALIIITTRTGADLIPIIKGDPTSAHIPSFLLSGSLSQQELEESGADEFMHKPLDLHLFFGILKKYLR